MTAELSGSSVAADILKRDRCWHTGWGGYRCSSRWSSWGRYVLAGVAIFLFFVILLSCLYVLTVPLRPCSARAIQKRPDFYFPVPSIVYADLDSLRCMARRRRKRGHQPFYGTGWMAPPPKYGSHQNDYNMGNNQQQQQGGQQDHVYHHNSGWGAQNFQSPPPAYGNYQQNPQYTGTTFNPHDGYYGQNSGVQSPPASYQPDNVYPPPPGPPGTVK